MLYDSKGNVIAGTGKTLAKTIKEVATRDTTERLTVLSEHLPNPSKILKDRNRTIEIFDEVARQGDVLSAIQNYRDGIASMEYQIESSEENSERAAWFEDYFKDIDIEQLKRDAASTRDYGYTVFEIVDYMKVGKYELPSRIVLKPRVWFGYDVQNRLRFYSKEERNGVLVDDIYPRKFITLQHESSYENPYGIGLLDLAYWRTLGLNANFEFWLAFLEEDGRDKWFATHPANAKQPEIDATFQALSMLYGSNFAVFPEGTNIDKKDAKGRQSTSDAFAKFEESSLRFVLKLWFGTDLLMQVEGKGGYSSSQSGIEIRGDALSSGKRLVGSVTETLMRYIEETNPVPGSDKERLKFKLYRPDEKGKEDAEIEAIHHGIGVRHTRKYFEVAGWYKPDEFFLVSETGEGARALAPATGSPSAGAGGDPATDEALTTFAGDETQALLDAYTALKARLKKK